MELIEIEKKAKFVTNNAEKAIEVILPFEIYQQLIELQTSMENYQQTNTQESIKKAKKEIERGNTLSFKNMDEAIGWLDK